DVGPVLKREREKFPKWFQEKVDELASISRSLRKERELAMYGDEEAGVSPEELYIRSDAEYALKLTEIVLFNANKLLSEIENRYI
ncbi:MAG: DNA-binding protein, partial [Candidatus Bathyarchaeia archaeon]